MMGRKQKLNYGGEFDVVSKWRHILCYCHRPGVKKTIKQQMNRRDRRVTKRELLTT